MDGESDPPQRPQENGPDDEQGEGTSRPSAQDVPGREVTDNEGKEQEGPKNPEEKREDKEKESKESKTQLLSNFKSQSGKKEENPKQPGNEDYKKEECTEGKGTKEGVDPTKGGNDNTKGQGDKDNVALNEKEDNKTGKEEGSGQGDEDNKNVEVTNDRADLTNENKTEQGDGNDVTPNENEDDETEGAADINREQQPAGGQGIPSTVTDLTVNTSSSSETLQSSTDGVGELDSSGEILSPGRTPFSSLPSNKTSTPGQPSGSGLLNENTDKISSEPSKPTSVSDRPRLDPVRAGKKQLFPSGTPTNQSSNISADSSTHPKATRRVSGEQLAPSQTNVDDGEKQNAGILNASAQSPEDSGMGYSPFKSFSTFDHFTNPEPDRSFMRGEAGQQTFQERRQPLPEAQNNCFQFGSASHLSRPFFQGSRVAGCSTLKGPEEEEIQQLKTQNDQLINQLEQQKEGISRLTEDNNTLIVDRDRLNGEKQEQTTELVAFYRERDNLTNQMTKLVGERDGLNAECNGLRAYKADLESQNENLQQERADLQDRVSELEREGEEKDEKISVLSTTISQNSDMVATADEKTRRFQDVDMRLQHAQLSCSSLQSKLDEATASVQQLEAALKESNEGLGQEIVQLQANLYRLTNERDELQTTSENQVSQLTGDMDALRTKCDSLNVWVEKLTDAKACLEGEKNDLEGKLRRTEKEKKNLIADHEVLEAQNNSSEAAMREIADKRRQLEELKENLEDQVADLQAEVKRKDEHTYGLSDTVARQSHALEGKERLEIEHQDVVTRLSDSQHQCATLQANVTDFTGRTQRLEAALAKEIEDHTREANALKVRVHELSNELGELQESSEREIASLAEVRSTLRSDCDRLNVRVDELENNKKRLEDKNRDLGERLKATERKAEELTTQKRVLERQKKTAEDQSVAYGQTSTVYQAQATQLQDLANAYRAQLETLTAQLRQRNESVLPLEMEARRARLEAQDTAAKLERTTKEKDLLVITVDALKAEVQLTALAIQDWHRKEADLRREIEKQVAQKNRYVKETQLARTQVKQLEEKAHQLELQEANRFRRGFPRLD